MLEILFTGQTLTWCHQAIQTSVEQYLCRSATRGQWVKDLFVIDRQLKHESYKFMFQNKVL